MSETERLIDETLRLDAEATKGPWERHDMTVGQVAEDYFRSVARFTNGPFAQRTIDADLMASYRSSAPRLARMLKMHQELASGIANGTQPPWLDEAKKLEEIRPYESLESKAARYVINKCDEIAKGEA